MLKVYTYHGNHLILTARMVLYRDIRLHTILLVNGLVRMELWSRINFRFTKFIPDNDDQQTKIVNQLRTTISGLRKYTNYSMTVLAYTSVGDGARSVPVYCQTEEDGKI